MGVFKAYDIRGIYPSVSFNQAIVYKIGACLPSLLGASTLLLGYDCRKTTPEICEALCRGITDSGADVDVAGFATTPMVYYLTARKGYGASVQITASHNPKEYNGLKISRKGALPVGYGNGLKELEAMLKGGSVPKAEHPGNLSTVDFRAEYLSFLNQYKRDYRSLRIAVDCSNGMAGFIARDVFGDSASYLYEDMDGDFPNHAPNPLEEENVADLKEIVKKQNCDIGIIFDGDADRVMFVDEQGAFISPDLITAVLGAYFLNKNREETVLYDIRTSRSVDEYVKRMGGKTHMWKVGHAHAKLKMRELNAVVGGELAGHYYFRDFYFCDSAMLAAILVLNVLLDLQQEGRTLSTLISEISTYAYSGERNFEIEEKAEAIARLKKRYCRDSLPQKVYDFDGYRIEFEDWWFNVRPSNTEPYLRLVLEARNTALMQQKLEEVVNCLIRGDE